MTMTLRYAHLTQKKAVNLLNGLTALVEVDCHKTVTNLTASISATGQFAQIIGRGERI